jgi:hypothetical protein
MVSTASDSAFSLGRPDWVGINDRTRGSGVAEAPGPATAGAPTGLFGVWAGQAAGPSHPIVRMKTAVHGHPCRFLIPSPPRNVILGAATVSTALMGTLMTSS